MSTKYIFNFNNGIFDAVEEESLTRILTPDEIKAMWAAPIEILPSPGAGYVRIFYDVIWIFHYNGVQYTGGGNTNIVEEGGVVLSLSWTAVRMNAAADRFQYDNTTSSGKPFLENKKWYVQNATGAFANGDSPLKFIIRYRTVSIT
jgi:hypothetical protein